MSNEFYDLEANALDGSHVDFSRFKGRVALAVNTASKCGFTPQYAGLQKLHETYHDKGLEILGFPCNQFGNQEPGDADTIRNECLINYGVSFQMFEKIDVNGPDAHPVFVWLRKRFPGLGKRKIKWNFTKFLLDRNGKPVKRFAPMVTPEAIESTIVALLES